MITINLFVLVHHFGHAQDPSQAATFCDVAGATLIEDAAHVLSPYGGIGQGRSFIFYSPAKVLAVPDGAVLVFPPDNVGDTVAFFQTYLDTWNENPSFYEWFTKRIRQN